MPVTLTITDEMVSPDGIVPTNVLGNIRRDAVTEIILPASARKIASFAFAKMPKLERVVLNNGLQRIESNAFQKCRMLETIELPASVVHIGSGAFRDCPELRDLSFRQGGTKQIEVERTNPFANTVDPKHLQDQCGAENVRRNAFRLQGVYAVVSQTAFFGTYCGEYKDAIDRYSSVANWRNENRENREALLKEIFYEHINPVSDLMQGGISEEAWEHFNRSVAVDICQRLAAAGADVGKVVADCRRRFDEETHRVTPATGQHRIGQHHALFNRIAASLLQDRQLVQIINSTKLQNVVDFLRNNGYVVPNGAPHPADDPTDEWYASSHGVYQALSAVFTDKSPFEIGVFAWCIAAVLHPEVGNQDDEAETMRQKMEASMKDYGFTFNQQH